MIKKARAENKHVDGYALGRRSQIYQRGKHRPGGCRDEMLEVNVHVCWCLRFTCQIYHVAKFDQTSSSGPHIVQNSGTWAVRSFFFFFARSDMAIWGIYYLTFRSEGCVPTLCLVTPQNTFLRRPRDSLRPCFVATKAGVLNVKLQHK